MKSPLKLLCKNIPSMMFTLSLILFIITFSISLPIYSRSFYYMHITHMNLAEKSGFTEAQIRGAYDSVLDYLTVPAKDFSTGDLKYSSEGKDHFSDCKKLFTLNTLVFFSSVIVLLTLFTLKKKKVRYFTFSITKSFLIAGIFLILTPLIIGVLASLDFNYAFVVFHKIFFPQKSNWIFNPRYDEIIRILPQEYFMNCAVLIGTSILFISVLLILIAFFRNRKRLPFYNKKSPKQSL